MSEIRTRFAPSPTGFLHVGSIRTNFFAWLLARHFGGKFILRIEDTDRERLVPGAVKGILEDLSWLNLDIDEGPTVEELEACDASWEGATGLGGPYGPYVQSQRLPRYHEIAEELINKGVAYRCDCTPEMIKKEREEQIARKETPGYSGYCRKRQVPADRPHVVRFRIPERTGLSLDDAVKGRITWESLSLRDTIIVKSDGYALYHLAVVVDDHDMKITHVIRGEEWIATTPIHLLIYEALGWKVPIFCHLPSVLGQDGKKLSKRHGATEIRSFREQGYLPEALLNFLLLVGWSPGEGDEQEIFSREEMIQRFSLDRVNSAPGTFEYGKLDWMNGVYIRSLPVKEFIARSQPFLEARGIYLHDEKALRSFEIIAPHVQERTKRLTEVPDLVHPLFADEIERDLDSICNQKKGLSREALLAALEQMAESIDSLGTISEEDVEPLLKDVAEREGVKHGPVFLLARIAVLGKKNTPPLGPSFEALGREVVLKRLRRCHSLIVNG